jgi:hypothetical protein
MMVTTNSRLGQAKFDNRADEFAMSFGGSVHQLSQPALKKAPLRLLLGQGERPLV